MTDTLQELVHTQQHRAEQLGGKHIGSLLWWSLCGNRITHEDLEGLALAHELPEQYLPAPIKPTTAFRRAWRHVASQLKDNLLLRQITESTDGIVVGLVQERADSHTEALDYEHLVTVSFGKHTHLIGTNQQHIVVDEIRSQFQHFLLHTTQDIRAMLLAFVKDTAVSLRDRGGVYFIPAPYQELLQAMIDTVQEAGQNVLHQLPLYDSPQTQHVLNTVAFQTLDQELKQLDAELQTFLGDEKTRRSTLLKRLDVFDALRARVSTFAGVLSFEAGNLQQKVNQLQSELKLHLGIIEEPEAVSPQQESKKHTTDKKEHSPTPTAPTTPARQEAPKPWDEPAIEDDPNVDPFFVYDADVGF